MYRRILCFYRYCVEHVLKSKHVKVKIKNNCDAFWDDLTYLANPQKIFVLH